jgi:lactate dehydrogenase-like 2-hydroxyacid dehydrogenase
MAMRILWPNLPARLVPVATEAVGSGFDLDFNERFEDVSDEQWAKADAVVGGCLPQYIDKLKACRIFVKYGVGYDDVDIERFGKLGIPVCNVPDYGTREVADHAIAMMMTLAKSVAYHDSELRADLKGNWRRSDDACRSAHSGSSAWAGSAPRRRCAPRPSTWTWCSTTPTSRTATSSRSGCAAPTRWPS